jgi:hypothetical protein
MPRSNTLLQRLLTAPESPRTHGLWMPLGGLLNDLILNELTNGRGDWRLGERVKDLLRYARTHVQLVTSKSDTQVGGLQEKVLVTWMGAARTADLMGPVIKALGPDRCIGVITRRAVCSYPTGQQFTLAQVPWPSHSCWRREWNSVAPSWWHTLSQIHREGCLPRGARLRMWLGLMNATQRILGWIELLRNSRPSAVVTEYDRNANSCCLVLAARHLGIPTFTLTHGVVHEGAVGYAPILADYIYNWGEADRVRLIEAGVPPERCILAGCPRMPISITTDAMTSKELVGVPPSTGVTVMLGISPWQPDIIGWMIGMCSKALAAVPGASGFIRLHPSLKPADVQSYIPRNSPLMIAPTSLALEECLAATDIVVSGGSGLIEDSLTAGRPAAVIVAPGEGESSWSAEVIRRAQCPRISSTSELAATLRRAIDMDWRRRQLLNAEGYLCWAYAARGKTAAVEIARHIQLAISERR